MDSTSGTPDGRPPAGGSPGGGDPGSNARGGNAHGGDAQGGRAPHESRGVTVAAYLALFLLGAALGLIGTFHYSQGPAPLAAILFDLAILATCVLGSTGMRSALGGALPAAGWFVVTLVLSTSSAGGSILVTDTPAGKWFLFGGAVCAAAGGVYAFAVWSRPSRDHRARQSSDREPERGPHEDGSGQASGSARTPRRPGR